VIDADTRGCDAIGAADEGDECGAAGTDDCEAGLVCLGGSEGDNLCKRYCDADRDCTGGDGSICVGQITVGGDVVADAMTCSISCNPTSATGCRAGTNCGIFLDGAVSFTDCYEEEDPAGTQGALCADGGPYCARGYACVTLDGVSYFCGRYCDDPGGIGACAGADACTPFDPAATIGGTEYGVCT
jgi:hypothetical protein